MTHSPQPPRSGSQAGFSLVELTIVVVVLGVLAMMAVPKYHQLTERSKAVQAYAYLQHVEKAQEMYRARHGRYAKQVSELQLGTGAPQFFTVGAMSSLDWETKWQLKLTRAGASQGYGAYTVAWNEDGFSAARSSIAKQISPTGIGGKLTASSASRGSTAYSGPRPTGSLKWNANEPLDFEEHRNRLLTANSLDYKQGEDPYLDTMLWFLNVINNWGWNGNTANETQEETNERFFALNQNNYEEGEDYWLDWIISWHHSNTAWRLGWI